MYIFSAIVAFLVTTTAAQPIATSTPHTKGILINSTALQAIAPSSTSCDNAPKAGECRTAAQAAPAIHCALTKYNVHTAGEAAAVIATMAFESGEFKYQRNVYPGRPGQGTRNMQMIDFNLKYARSIPALAVKVAAIAPAGTNGSALSDADKNKVVDMLVAKDNWDFGSAVWFLATQCTPDTRTALASGTTDAFAQYVTSCIGTTNTPERLAYYQRALAALK